MCFSPQADFGAAAVVGVIGVATLRRVRTRRELLIGALPALFAVHQFVEGFVWLGLQGKVSSGLADAARDGYVIFAYAVLPVIVPLGFWLLEPVGHHRRWLHPFVALGLATGAFLLWEVTQYPIQVTALPHCISYATHTPNDDLVGVAYVVATCGPALISSRMYLRWFGAVNLVSVAVALTARDVDFASVWCFYAALASLLILEHFRRERRSDKVAWHPVLA
jgi:uncharacterized protein DUF6629